MSDWVCLLVVFTLKRKTSSLEVSRVFSSPWKCIAGMYRIVQGNRHTTSLMNLVFRDVIQLSDLFKIFLQTQSSKLLQHQSLEDLKECPRNQKFWLPMTSKSTLRIKCHVLQTRKTVFAVGQIGRIFCVFWKKKEFSCARSSWPNTRWRCSVNFARTTESPQTCTQNIGCYQVKWLRARCWDITFAHFVVRPGITPTQFDIAPGMPGELVWLIKLHSWSVWMKINIWHRIINSIESSKGSIIQLYAYAVVSKHCQIYVNYFYIGESCWYFNCLSIFVILWLVSISFGFFRDRN